MALDHDRAGLGAQSLARVPVRLALVGPIAYLLAVDPYGDMGPFGDDGF